MRTLLEKIQEVNFKKVFIGFFAALVSFGIIYAIVMAANGNTGELTIWWNRITLARIRGRMFTDVQSTFRFFAYLFLFVFNAILALWVYVDNKKHENSKAFWPVFTLFTGLIGWLIYMIRRLDSAEKRKVQEN